MPVAGSAVLWVRASEPEEGGELLLRSCRARWLRPGLQARAVWSWVSQGVEKGRPKLTWALIGTPVSHSWRMEEQKYISFQVMLANCHTTCRWVSQPCCASVWLNILQHTHTHTHTSIGLSRGCLYVMKTLLSSTSERGRTKDRLLRPSGYVTVWGSPWGVMFLHPHPKTWWGLFWAATHLPSNF